MNVAGEARILGETLVVKGELKKVTSILWTETEIKERIKEVAREIADVYKPIFEKDKDAILVLACILHGAMFFTVDLVKEIHKILPSYWKRIRIDSLAISSYGKGTKSGKLKIEKDFKNPIEDFHVLVVEDIIDTGYTYSYLNQLCKYKGAKSLRGATLISKGARREYDTVDLSFVGFKIKEDVFIIGYGLDADEQGRQLPFIAAIENA